MLGRIVLGVLAGLAVGCLLLLVGAVRVAFALLAGADVSVAGAASGSSLFICGAILGGSLAGAAWPLRTSRTGAAVVGIAFVGGTVFVSLPLASADDPYSWPSLASAAITALILGGGVGVTTLYQPVGARRPRGTSA